MYYASRSQLPESMCRKAWSTFPNKLYVLYTIKFNFLLARWNGLLVKLIALGIKLPTDILQIILQKQDFKCRIKVNSCQIVLAPMKIWFV
jgi:hypothetical protein